MRHDSLSIRFRLGVILGLLALAGATVSRLPFASNEAAAEGELDAAVVWLAVWAVWLWLIARHVRPEHLWRLPSTLFRAGLGVAPPAVVVAHLPVLQQALGDAAIRRNLLVDTLEDMLFTLGAVALASLAAFAIARSLLRPALVNTRPPTGARDVPLRMRFAVATTGASFATAGTLLDVLVDFDRTPDEALVGFLGTALVLVTFSALIGWLVGDDAARGVESITRRMRELASAADGPVGEPSVSADEVGDLTLAAAELERRIRRDEAIAAASAERERVARELHDGVAKSVSVLALEAATLAARLDPQTSPQAARIERLAQVLAEELRSIVHDFRSRGDAEPFAQAVRRAVRAYPGAALAMEGDLDRLGALARFETLRILDEALRNAERHAQASRVEAHVGVDDGRLRLVIEDDGKGTPPFSWSELAARGHFGLLGMRERARLLDGDLRVEPRAGGGTRVTVEVPLADGDR